jgi:DNA-binding NarL/FixJ family response regulator
MEQQKKISVLIAEDHTLLREAWTFMLERDGRFEVLGETGDVHQLMQLAEDLKPKVIMLDININGVSTIDLIPLIKAKSLYSAILGVSLHSEPIFAKRMIEYGAMGYVTKNSSGHELLQAILQVSHGKKYICEEILTKLSDRLICDQVKDDRVNSLSTREVEIVKQISKGFSSKEIGCILNITRKTVEVHRYNIMKKLSVPNAAGLVNFFNQHQMEFEEKLRAHLPQNKIDYKNGSSYFLTV